VPLFKLQVVLLAKTLWDARQCPTHVATMRFAPPWPAALTRAVTQLCSPCVAGDLLRQRAPGLLPHVRPSKQAGSEQTMRSADMLRSVAPAQLGWRTQMLQSCYIAAAGEQRTLDATGELESRALQRSGTQHLGASLFQSASVNGMQAGKCSTPNDLTSLVQHLVWHEAANVIL
jgi:hypothetical protein